MSMDSVAMNLITAKMTFPGGVSPVVLPCLQSLYPEKFNAQSMIHTIDIHEELPPHESSNKQTLGELMLSFLEYYSTRFE
jgi:poly(A) RNA polymerase GLD2